MEDEYLELAERALLYRVLARAYLSEPDQEFVETVSSVEIQEGIKRIFPDFVFPASNQLEELAEEYCRLFINPGVCGNPRVSVRG